MGRMLRAATFLLLGAYSLGVALVLTQETPTVASSVVQGVADLLGTLRAPAALAHPARVEMLLNVGLFVPVAFLARLAWPRHPWANWVVYGFVASAGIEFCQGWLWAPRSAQYVDVVANTLGVLVGVVIAGAVQAGARRRRAHLRAS